MAPDAERSDEMNQMTDLREVSRERAAGLVSVEELRGVLETRDELGPDYEDAVIESFADKLALRVGDAIDDRVAVAVDSYVNEKFGGESRPRFGDRFFSTVLALGSMVFGIGATAVAGGADSSTVGSTDLLYIWGSVALINLFQFRAFGGRGRG
jgi:hypothetical protein